MGVTLNATLFWILLGSVIFIGVIGAIAFTIIKLKVKKMREEYLKELDLAEMIANKGKKDPEYNLDSKPPTAKQIKLESKKKERQEIISKEYLEKLDKSSLIATKNGKQVSKKELGTESIIARKNLGELLWDFDAELINKKINHLAFVDMEFLVNIIFRNQYKKIMQTNVICGYELITIAKMANVNTYFEKIEDKKAMDQYAKKYKIESKMIQKVTNETNFDLILIPEFSKDINGIVDDAYKQLAQGGMIFIPGLKNRKNKKYINELKKYLRLLQYRFEESQASKNIFLIAK